MNRQVTVSNPSLSYVFLYRIQKVNQSSFFKQSKSTRLFSINKTAGYYRHNFCPPTFIKDAFQKVETIFFINTVSPANSLIFPNLKNFGFFFARENSIYGEKTYFKKFARILQQIWYLYRF